MRLLLLLVSWVSLVLAGAFFSHQQTFAEGAHEREHSVNLSEPVGHNHMSSVIVQNDLDSGTLHCGSKILALTKWTEDHYFAGVQKLNVGQSSYRAGIGSALDPPPPRTFPLSDLLKRL